MPPGKIPRTSRIDQSYPVLRDLCILGANVLCKGYKPAIMHSPPVWGTSQTGSQSTSPRPVSLSDSTTPLTR